MHNKYNDLFDTLVKSYYNGNFEETLSTKALTGEIEANFIEGMGCVGGPKAIIPKEQGKISVDNLAYDSPIKIATHSSTMDSVLEKLNITSLKDFEDHNKTKVFHRNF